MANDAYRTLDAWQKAMDLVTLCYDATSSFPSWERYGLAGQIRRAAVSIPSNLAEGYCRRTTRAYANHVSIALGSHGELETLCEIAKRLHLMTESEALRMIGSCHTVGRFLSRLYQARERKQLAAHPSGTQVPRNP